MTSSTALIESTRALRDCCEKLERIVAELPDEPGLLTLRFEVRVLLERSRTLLALSDMHDAKHHEDYFDPESRTDHGREDEREKRYERLYEKEFK